MKDFEERQRELFRSHTKTNMAEFSKTSNDTMTILSTRKLLGRRDAQYIAQSLMIARQPAWAAISVNLHNQLKQLAKETTSYLGTKYAVAMGIDTTTFVDDPVLGLTIPRWLGAAEMLEHQRVLRAMKDSFGLNGNPIEAFSRHAPYSLSNSSVAAVTVTSAASVMNRIALEVFKLADIKRYKLETNGDIRNPKAYELQYGTGESPRAPAFIGDRSYPVPA